VEGDMEGFGIVLLEANMAETPAVASDLEGIKDVISAGKNGYRIPVFDAAKFSETVDEVLQDDLEHLSQQTRRYVQQKFSWEKVAHKYTIFLKQVIARYSTKNSKK
jgi:phosphatidylinositol alpha-1,6-mannosyltransferase